MKRFIVKICVLTIGMFFLLSIADWFYTKYYRTRTYYPFSTWADIVGGRLNSELWVLGSSRALVQYNPIILDTILDLNSYVLGFDATHIAYQIESYQIARKYNVKPQYIILDLLWQSLDMYIEPISRYFYLPYVYNKEVRQIIIDNKKESLFYLYIPCFRYQKMKTIEKLYENYHVYKGFQPRYDNWTPFDKDNLNTIHYGKERIAIELVDRFLSDCRKDSISVILVHSPFQRDGFEKIQDHDKMLDLFRNIANQNDVPFLDYTNDPICYDTLYFYNAMHLNAHGADIFSAKLAHDLDSLGLIPTQK